MRARVPKSGVTIGNPEFEWRDVARAYGYTFQAFMELSVDEQAATIAHHRVRNQIEAVLSHDAVERQRKAARAKK